jgi:hypothetical protein
MAIPLKRTQIKNFISQRSAATVVMRRNIHSSTLVFCKQTNNQKKKNITKNKENDRFSTFRYFGKKVKWQIPTRRTKFLRKSNFIEVIDSFSKYLLTIRGYDKFAVSK